MRMRFSFLLPVALLICSASPAISQENTPLVGIDNIDTAAAPSWFDGDNLRSLIESSLIRSQKFAIPERASTALAIRSQNLQAKGFSSGEVRDPLNFVNYLVTSRVVELSGWPDQEDSPGLVSALFQIASGAGKTPKRNVTLSLDVRISNLKSGKVLFSGIVSESIVIPPQQRTFDLKKGSEQSYLPIDVTKIREFNQLLSAIAVKISSNIVLSAQPVMVISQNSGLVTLNYGSEYIGLGSKYQIYQVGADLVDPYTKKVIGNEETLLGIATVNKVLEGVSYASFVPVDKKKSQISAVGAVARKLDDGKKKKKD